MADNDVAHASTAGGADEHLVRVLEDTAMAKIMEKLEQPLQNIVREAVREAVVHAVHSEGRTTSLNALAPRAAPRRKRTATAEAHRPKAGGRCDAVWKELDK